jgi:hypothetical protein
LFQAAGHPIASRENWVSDDDSTRRILSRKELFREQRRAAYQAQKERRAQDPRYLAMKEAVKAQRRAAYQAQKERRKAEEATEKGQAAPAPSKLERLKAARTASAEGSAKRPSPDDLLLQMPWLVKGSSVPN